MVDLAYQAGGQDGLREFYLLFDHCHRKENFCCSKARVVVCTIRISAAESSKIGTRPPLSSLAGLPVRRLYICCSCHLPISALRSSVKRISTLTLLTVTISMDRRSVPLNSSSLRAVCLPARRRSLAYCSE